MKRFTLSVMAAICFFAASSVNAQTKTSCGTLEMWKQAVEIDPSAVLKRQQTEDAIEKFIANQNISRTDNDEVRIIPVVYHVIHTGGQDNISDAQILDQMRILNEDYRRKNADTTNTYGIFKPVAADSKIEFRLATKDPYGNCTSGINRVYSNRSFNFNNYAKSIINWPSDKYLNIWVCKYIEQNDNRYGTVIGYAQFPVGPSKTDGVVLAHDFVGTIGSAAGNAFYAGRDATHEVGHWLDLIHIWGDAQCGNDGCEDTPLQFDANSGCPAFPRDSLCYNGPEMTDNYMDYTNGNCKDIFTLDQKKRMRAALDVARYTLWQQSNLEATGTADPYVYPPACAPKADILFGRASNLNLTVPHISVCAGSKVYFKDNSTGGAATSWNWSFPGGNPSSSSLQSPNTTYNTPGTYHVYLTATNAYGSSTVDVGDAVVVDFNNGVFYPPFTEGFEGSFPSWDWRVYSDDGGSSWNRTTRAAYSGSACVSIQNYETIGTTAPYSVKELITQSFNCLKLQSNPTPNLKFRLSYGQQFSGNRDTLRVYASTTCGVTWSLLKEIGSVEMSALSAGFQPNNFAPTKADQWAQIALPLNAYTNKPNVRFKFALTTNLLSNNIYLDDINIDGVVGVENLASTEFNFNTYPNPASESFTVNYVLKQQEEVIINLYDLQGRFISQIENKRQSPGIHETKVNAAAFNLASGVYILKMITPGAMVSQKLVYTAN